MIYGFFTHKLTGDYLVYSFLRSLPEHLFHSKQGLHYKNRLLDVISTSTPLEKLFERKKGPLCFSGFLRGTKEVYKIAKKHNLDFYFMDHPYFFHPTYTTLWEKLGIVNLEERKRWCRIVKNGFNCTKITDTDDTKYKQLKKFSNNHDELQLHDWRKSGEHVLVLPPSKPFYDLLGIDAKKLLEDTITLLKQHTDREIRIRYKKPEGNLNKIPIEKDFINCHAVVSFGTSGAIKAILKGVPVFCNENSPTLPVSETDFTRIEKPITPDREKWLYNLVNHQFSIDEMKSGKTYEYLQ